MQKLEKFVAGKFINQVEYKSFNPQFVNNIYSWDNRELTRLSEQAIHSLGQLDAYSSLVPNIDHFIRMYVLKEATISSRIEGTQTNMEEALYKESDIRPELRDDWKEVNNYVAAMNNALNGLAKLPLSTRIFKQVHFDLMQSVRGENKLPGEYRRSQNWIGGSNLKNAAFIPPIHQDVNTLMSDLEKFLNNTDTGLTHVMKIALAHYQFETIHPFLDGNGRLGRLLITLYLVDTEVLKKPVLYLSDYFEKNRTEYFDCLSQVREKNELSRWLIFFMKGVIATSQNSINSLQAIHELKKECEENRIYLLGKRIKVAKVLLDYLFQQPVLDAEDVSKATGLSLVSSYKLLNDFITKGILKEATGFKRNRIFLFEEYFTIFKK